MMNRKAYYWRNNARGNYTRYEVEILQISRGCDREWVALILPEEDDMGGNAFEVAFHELQIIR